jgi:hypothetical protein
MRTPSLKFDRSSLVIVAFITVATTSIGLAFFTIKASALYIAKPAKIYSPQAESCAALIRQQEDIHKIPPYLLSSIALVESGRKLDSGGVAPWPWTVNAQRKGYVFTTKEKAVAFVRTLQSRGVRSINIGCMQINLRHHPKAFKSLEDAFDPKQNIAYGAALFKYLKGKYGSWHIAIARYHTGSKRIGARYRARVFKHWARLNPRSPILKEAIYQPVPARAIPAAILFSPSLGINKKSMA